MAVDVFMKLGGIEGESRDDKHKDEIDVLAWSWGMSNPGSAATHRGGGGAGKASFQDLSFTKFVDKATTDLMRHCATGAQIPDGKLTVRKAGEKPLEFIVITMKEILVTSVLTDGAGGAEVVPVENVTLNFSAFKYEYTPQRPDGGSEPPKSFSWDIAANKPA